MDKLERNKKRLRREILTLTDRLHRTSRRDREWHNVHALLNQAVDSLAGLGESTDEKRLEWITPPLQRGNPKEGQTSLAEGKAGNK